MGEKWKLHCVDDDGNRKPSSLELCIICREYSEYAFIVVAFRLVALRLQVLSIPQPTAMLSFPGTPFHLSICLPAVLYLCQRLPSAIQARSGAGDETLAPAVRDTPSPPPRHGTDCGGGGCCCCYGWGCCRL